MNLRVLEVVLWKNLLIRKRHWVLTLLEAFMPITLFLLLVYARSKVQGLSKIDVETPLHFEPILLNVDGINVGATTFLVAPDDVRIKNIFHRVCVKFQIAGEKVHYFDTTEKLAKFYYKNHNESVVAVTFKGDDSKKFDYTIRYHEDGVVNYNFLDTSSLYKNLHRFEIEGVSDYYQHGFLTLQAALDVSFMEETLSKSLEDIISLYVREFPYPPHKEDPINVLIIQVLPLLTMLSFIFICPAVLKRVVEEKQAGTKELMKMVGMKSWMLWLGWFIYGMLPIIFSVSIIVFLLKVPSFNQYPPIEYCEGTILFVLLLLYCMASTSFCFAISSFFNKPTLAVIVGLLVWILSYIIPKNAMDESNKSSWGTHILLCLFPNMALHYGYSAIAAFEEREIGSHWSNISISGSDGVNDLTLLNVLLMFILNIFLFTIFTVYMDSVNPGKYGVRKSYFYPIQALKDLIMPKSDPKVARESVHLENIEDGLGLDRGIIIENLFKKFTNKMVVHNLSLDIYKNQITVLLGHNGAGKTTTMSIITGMLEASSGTVKIHGKDIRKNMDEIRKSIGLCPQHNLLFPDLTVREHLIFFAKLKGVSVKDAEEEVIDLLYKLHLSDKKNSMVDTLSGGMKRKLCLGMALIGGSKVLILDEPSSGLDPESRRELWDLLLQWRGDKTILITTHFMEEADALGDRIAIMSEGGLLCYGTPIFLKKRYDTGYHLTLTVDEAINTAEKDMIDKKVKEYLNHAQLISEDGNSIVYILPFERNKDIKNLLDALEERMDSLKLINISINATTLEDVFLKTRADVKGTKQEDKIENKIQGDRGKKESWKDIHPLWVKKKHFVIRKISVYLVPLAIAITFFGMTAYLSSNFSDYGNNGPALNISLSSYNPSSVYYNVTTNNARSELIQTYFKKMVTHEGSNAYPVEDVDREIINKGVENIIYYKQYIIVGAEFTLEQEKISAAALYSGVAKHSSPISLNLVTNTIAKALLGKEYSIRTTNFPLENVESTYSSQEYSKFKIYELWVFLVPFGCLFVIGSFMIFPYMEQCHGFAKLQYMCGVHPYIYWSLNFITDFIAYVLCMSIAAAILCFSIPLTRGLVEFGSFFSILVMYGASSIPLTYLFSRKKSLSGAFALFVITMMFLGIVLTFVVELMSFSQMKEWMEASEHWKNFFVALFPQVGLTLVGGRFAMKAVDNYNMDLPGTKPILCYQDKPCCKRDSPECAADRSFQPVLLDLLWMLISFFVYFFLNLCFDLDCLKKTYSKLIYYHNLKWDNESGKTKIDRSSSGSCDMLAAENVKKTYSGHTIVNNINFKLGKGKCLGILGVNGAGKTTTFRILTKEEFADSGNVGIIDNEGHPINEGNYLQKLGYCPQADAFNDILTGRQMLTLIAHLRNVYDDKVVDTFLDIFELTEHADKPCGHYSGGNKRKLSLAVSIIGLPPFVLLDEPTNGVDPSARRKCWNLIKAVQKKTENSFILTSHSMHECEALCNELKIMKDGEFVREGTISTLKKEFGGFSIKLKLFNKRKFSGVDSESRDEVEGSASIIEYDEVDGSASKIGYDQVDTFDSVEGLKRYLVKNLKAEIKDEHSGLLHVYLKEESKRWSVIFEEMEKLQLRNRHLIEDYVISEASLEDVFLSVAREEKKNHKQETHINCFKWLSSKTRHPL